MDRKEYWNNTYVQYWKEKVNEANTDNGIYINKGDIKTGSDNVIQYLINELKISAGTCVLDVGCGFCRTYPLLNKHCDYFGCDISEDMIAEAKKQHPELSSKLTVCEAETLPYSTNYFDYIICFGVYACYQESALMEMLRVLKIGGKLIITGKNSSYKLDDEKAYIAEIRAREKNHPNYFTDVKAMLAAIKSITKIISEKYFIYRGDFSEYKYTDSIPDSFYEYALIIQKTTEINSGTEFPKFSDKYSATYRIKNKGAL